MSQCTFDPHPLAPQLLTKMLDTVGYAAVGSQQRLADFEAEIEAAKLEALRDTPPPAPVPVAAAAGAPPAAAVPDAAPEGGAEETEEDPYRPAAAAL